MDSIFKVDTHYGLLVLEPKESFLTWVRTAAIQCDISPSEIARGLSKKSLINHALVMVSPSFPTVVEQDDFITKHKDVLFDAMIDSWVFPPKYWPKDRSASTLRNLFTISYFNSIVDIFNNSEEEYKQCGGMSLFIVKPKNPAIKWFQTLCAEDKIAIPNKSLLIPDVFKKIGSVCSVAPFFSQEKDSSLFIKQNYSKLFDYALTKYCSDTSLWIQDRSYDKFWGWFECLNYSPILSEELWEHPEMMQHY